MFVVIFFLIFHEFLFVDKTEEFTAHASNVNCVALGRKSGHVLVTGGDDKKVNLWAIGKKNCLLVSSKN